MKKTITLLFLVLLMSIASAQDTLTAAQMREDFTYMMEQYERVHPNPTWSLGGERYNELKQQTLAQLDHPMTQLDFWRIIARWNQYFDGHTMLGWPELPPSKQITMSVMAFPPYSVVQYREGKLFFSDYEGMPDSLRGAEIVAFEGHPSTEIINNMLPYVSHESEALTNSLGLQYLHWYYRAFYGCSREMEIRYRSATGEQRVTLDRRTLYHWLVDIGDKSNIGGVGQRDIPWHFYIFPQQGIALLELNKCRPDERLEQFDTEVSAFIDSVNLLGIRHLFVDLSQNQGGNDMFCYRFLQHIAAMPDSAVLFDFATTYNGTAELVEDRYIKTFQPEEPQYSGRLYFIQSHFTYSASIVMVNLVKQYRLGTLIGEETGGLTTTYIRLNQRKLPNSGLAFYCSDKQNRYFGTTGPRGVLPDIPLEIGYKYLFRSFTPEELQQLLVDHRQYNLNLRIEGDTLQVSGFYLIPDTTSSGQPIKVDTTYSLPLADYRTADGAIVLRREGDWYPHKNGELLTAQVHIKADDYYIIGGSETAPSFDIHLVLLPKDQYACKVIDTPTRPFHFYRLASDTTQYPEAYYNEFIDSYNFYCSFFGDSLSSKPMNIVEIGDPQFVMCQSLRDMIIFGHYFYDVYTMIPDFSWIPHEVAHQWWGDGIFFEYRDYALGESLNEYIKLQYLKNRGRGYEEQLEYYKATMEMAEKHLPLADIHSLESQDESIAIYHAAPYRLTLEDMAAVNTTLQQLYRKYKHTVVSRDTFLQECKTLQHWLQSEQQ